LTEQELLMPCCANLFVRNDVNYSKAPRRRFSRQGFGPRYRTPGEPAIRLDQYRA
jgi:hypothetical protein